MSLFDKREQVYGPEEIQVGKLDLSVPGCYQNVISMPLDVRPKRKLYVKVVSDNPVDVLVAREDGSSAGHKDAVRDAVLGPYDTGKAKSMGVFLGVYPGDKANVTLEVWTERE